jgi:hypothetical protein
MEPIPIDLIGMVLERSMDLGTVFALMGVSKKANMHFKTLNKMWFKLCWKHFKLDGVAVSVARKKNSVSVFDIFRDCAVRGCWRTELGFNPGELFMRNYRSFILLDININGGGCSVSTRQPISDLSQSYIHLHEICPTRSRYAQEHFMCIKTLMSIFCPRSVSFPEGCVRFIDCWPVRKCLSRSLVRHNLKIRKNAQIESEISGLPFRDYDCTSIDLRIEFARHQVAVTMTDNSYVLRQTAIDSMNFKKFIYKNSEL